jgi:hypothetical protein
MRSKRMESMTLSSTASDDKKLGWTVSHRLGLGESQAFDRTVLEPRLTAGSK